MKKFFIGLSVFILAFILLCCKEERLDSVNSGLVNNASGSRQSEARMGPGYSYNFSTSMVSGEYYDPPSGSRQFYLKGSVNYVRQVILTVTKLNSNSSDPVFRIYGNTGQCLSMSFPQISAGTYTATSFTHPLTSLPSSGFSWTVPMSSSPIGTTATYEFWVYLDSTSSCIEGFFATEMTSPSWVPNVGNYWDGDYMYFVKNSSL